VGGAAAAIADRVISVVAKSAGNDDLRELHVVRPIVERVNDPRTLMDAVAGLDQCIDAVIVEPGPAADHVDDMNGGGVKMEAGAAPCLRALRAARTSCTRTWPLVAAVTPASR
jgi:hypothetical protein